MPDLQHIALQNGFLRIQSVLHHEQDGPNHVSIHRLVLGDVHCLQDLLDAQQDEVKVFV